MRIVGVILTLSIALALFKAVLAVLMACYVLTLVIAVLVKPAETLGLLGFFILCFLLHEHTVATLALFAVLYAFGAVTKV